MNLRNGAYRQCANGFNAQTVCNYAPGYEGVNVTFAFSGGAGSVNGTQMYQGNVHTPLEAISRLGPFVLPDGVASGTLRGHVDGQELCHVTLRRQ